MTDITHDIKIIELSERLVKADAKYQDAVEERYRIINRGLLAASFIAMSFVGVGFIAAERALERQDKINQEASVSWNR